MSVMLSKKITAK